MIRKLRAGILHIKEYSDGFYRDPDDTSPTIFDRWNEQKVEGQTTELFIAKLGGPNDWTVTVDPKGIIIPKE